MNQFYTGYTYLDLSDENLALFYENPTAYLTVSRTYPNEYFIIHNSKGESVDYYKMKDGEAKRVGYTQISSDITGLIKPRNEKQRLAIDLLQNRQIGVKLLRGVYGSGLLI